MAFDETLGQRIEKCLAQTREQGFSSQKMFGGLAFLLHGNMCVGVWKESLVVRIPPEHAELRLGDPYVRAFDVTGKPMKGWLLIDPGGLEDERDLMSWIKLAVEYGRSLPRK
jgi:TfoX/Sxy family transcriptional regulator of competence genes